jgi:hypothetical protein
MADPGDHWCRRRARQLIRRISRENPLWGAPRIHGELLKLGIDIGETSVGKYLVRRRKPPAQDWRTFLENPVKIMVSLDFFTVPSIRPIRRPSGLRNNSGRPFPLSTSLVTCFGTATRSSALSFERM